MKFYIEIINKFEKRNIVNTTRWRTIYEIIEEDYFGESDFFWMILYKDVGIMKIKLLIYHLR